MPRLTHYTPREYAEMHLIYGECGGNATQSAALYREKFPDRPRHPDYRVFIRVHSAYAEGRIPGTGVGGTGSGRPQQVDDDAVLAEIDADPTTSVRVIARKTSISTRTVHRILKREKLHPYHYNPNMPKKFVGENSKAVAARQRKADTKTEQEVKKKAQLEDESWRDDDKGVLKKQQKKEDLEKKRLEQLQKKAEAKELLEKEMQSIKSAPKPAAPKLTRAQIMVTKEKQVAQKQKIEETKSQTPRVEIADLPLEENLNRIQLDGEVAQSVEEAISILSDSATAVDKHPEKRMKAAYTAFEAVNMPRLKAENPSLRLSQLKQMLHKEWQKSPDNPLNQKF